MVHDVLQRTSLLVFKFQTRIYIDSLPEWFTYMVFFSGRHGLGWLRPSDEEVHILPSKILVLEKVMRKW